MVIDISPDLHGRRVVVVLAMDRRMAEGFVSLAQ
jgi:hypothetical protein